MQKLALHFTGPLNSPAPREPFQTVQHSTTCLGCAVLELHQSIHRRCRRVQSLACTPCKGGAGADDKRARLVPLSTERSGYTQMVPVGTYATLLNVHAGWRNQHRTAVNWFTMYRLNLKQHFFLPAFFFFLMGLRRPRSRPGLPDEAFRNRLSGAERYGACRNEKKTGLIVVKSGGAALHNQKASAALPELGLLQATTL